MNEIQDKILDRLPNTSHLCAFSYDKTFVEFKDSMIEGCRPPLPSPSDEIVISDCFWKFLKPRNEGGQYYLLMATRKSHLKNNIDKCDTIPMLRGFSIYAFGSNQTDHSMGVLTKDAEPRTFFFLDYSKKTPAHF